MSPGPSENAPVATCDIKITAASRNMTSRKGVKDARQYVVASDHIMPSHRRRSSSRDRSLSPARDHSRSRSRSPERRAPLPDGVLEISESDYFLKSDEFRVWLRQEKGKVGAPPLAAILRPT